MTGQALARVRRFALRVDAATPPHRDRVVDALRAIAIAGVIGGHWLVTALVPSSGSNGLALRDTSPLASMPALAPVSWIFQPLALFFLVGGYSAARGYRGCYLAWLRQRLARLGRPVAVLAAIWAPVTAGLFLAGCPLSVMHTLLTLVVDPLWFVGVYAALTALTPAAIWLAGRFGAWAAAVPVTIVAAVDVARFGVHGPAWVGWINLPAGWLVPYLLGVAWAAGALRGRKGPALMLVGGVAATAALITLAGYPASMVGVNGAAISNLNPPTIAAVTFGLAQCGLALLVRDRLARWMRRPLAWAAVATVNLSAMTLFLWHQTAFIVVTWLGMLVSHAPGLLTAPTSAAWVAERLAWLPAFAVVLAGLWLMFRGLEHARNPRRPFRSDQPSSRGLDRVDALHGAGLESLALHDLEAGRLDQGQLSPGEMLPGRADREALK